MAEFQLLDVNAPIPSGYSLATIQDVRNNRAGVLTVMPGWEIANLADGSVDGSKYGGEIRGEIRTDAGKKLVIKDPVFHPTTFKLINTYDALPKGYRLAMVQDVQANKEAVRKVMPGWEIANLYDGSVDGARYGLNTRDAKRPDAGKYLLVYDPDSISQKTFKLINKEYKSLPDGYRLATVQDVQANKDAVSEVMPESGIANLADGSVDGASDGINTKTEQSNDADLVLAVQDVIAASVSL